MTISFKEEVLAERGFWIGVFLDSRVSDLGAVKELVVSGFLSILDATDWISSSVISSSISSIPTKSLNLLNIPILSSFNLLLLY